MFASSHKIRDWKRFEHVLEVLGKYELNCFLGKIRFRKASTPSPSDVRKLFEELGGAFLKIGQLLSLRADLIPQEYCDEFAKLQDAVPPFSYEQVKKAIEQELKKPLAKTFSSFETKPLAAASIGQVHVAKLKNGRKVAVKIQRPGIQEVIEADLDILEYLAKTIQKHHPQDIVDLPEIVQEFRHYTENELDYEKEAKNIEAIRNNQLADKKTVIPCVYWEYTTSRILVMEYIEGKPLTQLLIHRAVFPRKKTASLITQAVFSQIFEHGLFHADPHPGNLFLLKGNRIAFLDFGIVGHLTREMQEQVTNLFVALIQHDVESLAETMARIGFVHRNTDMNQLKEDLRDTLGKYYNAGLRRIHFSELITHALQAARNNHIRLPGNFVLLAKCAITLEGLCRTLDPLFNLVETSKPVVEKLIEKRLNPRYIAEKTLHAVKNITTFAQDLPKLGNQLTETLVHSDSDIHHVKEDLDLMVHEINYFGNKLLYSLLMGVFLLGSVFLIHYDHYLWNGFPLLSLIGFILAGICFIRLFLPSNARMTS
ncbi:MAG: AarF/ABC1/UbiB kinase family protein [Nanoarchaeota archaeon]